MTATYSLTIPGNASIEISQDDLRTLLGEIESELHHSKVYQLALATVQKLLGESAEQAKFLFKAVGREAIGLVFRQLAQRHQETAKVSQEIEKSQETSTPNIQQVDTLKECLTNVKSTKLDRLSASQTNVTHSEIQPKKDRPKAKKLTRWLQSDQKTDSEQGKQTVLEQRKETLRQIGQQLRQARENNNLSLIQLNVYTHVPVHQMEAIENGDLDSLPEDVFVRGFIRVMGNALALNGTNLAATLPAPESIKTILPTWYKYTNTNTNISNSPLNGLALNPVHLYLGYTALVAGAVGGLSLLSHQEQGPRLIRSDVDSSSVSHSLRDQIPTTKPGLQSTGVGISVGHDISPPEAL